MYARPTIWRLLTHRPRLCVVVDVQCGIIVFERKHAVEQSTRRVSETGGCKAEAVYGGYVRRPQHGRMTAVKGI